METIFSGDGFGFQNQYLKEFTMLARSIPFSSIVATLQDDGVFILLSKSLPF
jgi:hypothetical protein